jgi:hypothetical protein
LFYPAHQVIASGSHAGKTLAEVPTADWFGLPEIMERPLGAGPYLLKSWVRGQEMVFEKNPYYWRGVGTLAFDQIKVVFDLPMNEAIEQIEAGTLHVLQHMPSTNSPDVKIYVTAGATWEHLDFNLDLYRQAVARHVPPSGGAVAAQVGITLSVPSGATGKGMDVVINDIGAPTEEMTGAQAPVRAFTLNASDATGNPITQFARPLTLVVTYSDADLAERGIDEETINLAFWNGNEWESLLPCTPCGVDRINNRITVVIDHFSQFAVTGSVRLFLPGVERH